MEIKQLITFYTVAREMSFSQAAVVLNYAQPTITTHIQNLELELGVPLFDRLGKKITLTTAGERLLTYAEHLIRMEGEARLAVTNSTDEPHGELVITTSGSILGYHLPPVLQRFREDYPAVRARVVPSLHGDIVEMVAKGGVDIGLAYRQSLPDTVDYIKLMNERLLWVCAPEHPLAELRNVGAQELTRHRILFYSRWCPLCALFDDILQKYDIDMSPEVEFYEFDSLKRYIKRGTGFSLMPAIVVAEDVERGELAVIDWVESELTIPIWFIWHRDKWMPPSSIAFRDLVIEMLAENVPNNLVLG